MQLTQAKYPGTKSCGSRLYIIANPRPAHEPNRSNSGIKYENDFADYKLLPAQGVCRNNDNNAMWFIRWEWNDEMRKDESVECDCMWNMKEWKLFWEKFFSEKGGRVCESIGSERGAKVQTQFSMSQILMELDKKQQKGSRNNRASPEHPTLLLRTHLGILTYVLISVCCC